MISNTLGNGETLSARIASSDATAFAQIHELYKTRLLYYARRNPALEWAEAEDLVADTFVALWNSRQQMKSDAHLRNFLFLTLRNKTINFITTKKRQEHLLEGFAAEQQGEQTIDNHLSADLVETEMLQLLLQAVQTLPTECRRVFELVYDQQHNSAEIARMLDIDPATVRSQKRRAITLIKRWIEKNDPEKNLFKIILLLCTLGYPHLY